MPHVPTTADVIPGACVNIVLKADQRTGRTVVGTVSNVLTRGNHPRGIKVRLTDGRVGRVQSMAAVGTTMTLTPMSAPTPTARSTMPATGASESGLPSEHISLDAYITRGKPRRNTKGASGGCPTAEEEGNIMATSPSEMVTCPVCGDFNGDEAAVAHHVASHFDE